MNDSFEQLIADMRDMAALQRSLELDASMDTYADRLEALVRDRALPPHGEGVAWDSALETTPIYADVLRGYDVPPGGVTGDGSGVSDAEVPPAAAG